MILYGYYLTDARVKNYVRFLSKRGIGVDILALREPDRDMGKEELSDKVTIYYLTGKYIGKNIYGFLWSYLIFFVFAFSKLTMLWAKHKYKIIGIHNMPNFIVFTAVFPRLFGSKVILDMHDIMSLNYQSTFGDKKLLINLLRIEETISAHFSNRVICADHYQEEFLINERGIDKGKTSVIMNRPALDIFEYRDQTNDDDVDFNIVYHGTITYRLGLDIIIKAIAKVKDAIPVKFYLYGTGDYMDECLTLIAQEGLQDTVHANRKFLPLEDMPDMLRDMDLGIVSNNRKAAIARYFLPVKMMEYMAMKIPVIAPKLENIANYFSEEIVCFYKPEDIDDLAENIVLLYKNKEKRRRLSEQAYDYIKMHNWEQEFDKYMGIIDEYIAERR
jgi:glycosyltransferase involved in cell wall biosynthesis